MVCDYPGGESQLIGDSLDVLADAIREAGQTIAQAILVAFLEPEDRAEQEQMSKEQAELERVMRLQRGSDDEAKGIGDS